METKSSIKLFLIPAIFFAVFFAFGNEAKAATTYYVSPMGNDDSNPGTEQYPFKTIQKGANSARAGDTVIVKDGVYNTWGEEWDNGEKYMVFVRYGGTSESRRVTIKSEHKWGAIIKGSGDVSQYIPGQFSVGFGHNTNVSYVTIQDFVIHDVQNAFHINNNNKHMIFKGNEIYNVWQGVSVGNGCDYITVDSNIIHDYGLDNDIYAQQGGTDQYHGIYLRGEDAVAQNNILYNHKGAGWHIQTGSYSVPPTGTFKIVNNTLVGHGKADHGQICFYSTNLDKVYIQNNIFYDPGSYIIRPPGDTGMENYIQNNLISNTFVNWFNLPYNPNILFTDNNIIGQDSKFIDLANHDFHLQSTSPAIDEGLAASALIYDIEGTLRPQKTSKYSDARFDIGAYEYVGGQPDATPPAAPAGLQVQ